MPSANDLNVVVFDGRHARNKGVERSLGVGVGVRDEVALEKLLIS
jgi:hypothetical protein